jgi:hypothetical protein
MELDIITEAAPAGWASALINGDESSFDYYQDAEDFASYEAFCQWLGEEGLQVVDCGEQYFSNSCYLHWSAYRGGDLVDYTLIRNAS